MKRKHVPITNIRAHNLSLILNLIWRQRVISRTDIINITNLSPATVSQLVNILLESDFVRESGTGESSGGRRPVLLEFNPSVRYTLGIDMGASHVITVLMDLGGNIIATSRQRYDVIADPPGAIDLIESLLHEVLQKANLPIDHCLGMGITVPVPLTGINNNQMLTYYMPAWQGIELGKEVSTRFYELPYIIENDANSGAIAEVYWGRGYDYENLAFVKLGTGVGCGLVINGQLFRGFRGSAGEIGHTTIQPNGRLCRCGNHGCLESYVGIPGILTDVQEAYKTNNKTPLPENIDQVLQAAQDSNNPSYKIIQEAGNYLGIAIANLLNLVNPGLIVLGGDLVQAGDVLLEPMRQTMQDHVIPIETQQSELTLSKLGDNAVAIGAATLVIHNAFQPSSLYQTLQPIQKGEKN